MYYQNYEDYMRTVLGYPVENQDTYKINYFQDTQNDIMPYQNTKELESYYPEIYKLINPIVCEVCDNCNIPITIDIVESMTQEVYNRIENNNEISIKINLDNRNSEKQVENKLNTIKSNSSRIINNESVRKNLDLDNRQRKNNNQFLRDLIKILILNRLIGRNFPNRPNYSRPPFSRETKFKMKDYNDYFKF